MPFVERFEYIGIANWNLIILPNVCISIWIASRLIKRVFNIRQKVGVFFVVAAVLSVIHFLDTREKINYMPTLLPAYKWGIIAGMAAILVMDFYFFAAGKLSRLKYSRLALIYMFCLLLIVFMTFYLTKILVLTDAYGLERMLREYEAEGKLIFFLVCFLQPILLPLFLKP